MVGDQLLNNYLGIMERSHLKIIAVVPYFKQYNLVSRNIQKKMQS